MSDNCPKCGSNLALVGRTHRCVANEVANEPDVANVPTKNVANAEVDVANTSDAKTYRYRDPEKRRTYMKTYMKKRREKK